jgi:hypothetical protein
MYVPPTIIDLTAHWNIIKQFANASMVGGKSHIIINDEERKQRLWRDQLVGQSGEAALHLYTSGSIQAYIDSRSARGYRTKANDGGTDLPRAQVDIKCSNLPPGKHPGTYTLFVRDKEFNENTLYYFGLMTCVRAPFQVYVMIAGWVHGSEYIDKARPYEFNGETVVGVPFGDLYPTPPIKWDGVKYLKELPYTHFTRTHQ